MLIEYRETSLLTFHSVLFFNTLKKFGESMVVSFISLDQYHKKTLASTN